MAAMSEPAVRGHVAEALRCVEHQGGNLSVEYRHGDLEVMVIEVAPGGLLSDASLCGRSAWHLVIDGQATLTAGESRWELLPGESLRLDEPVRAYTVHNTARDRLRLVSIVAAGDAPDGETAP